MEGVREGQGGMTNVRDIKTSTEILAARLLRDVEKEEGSLEDVRPRLVSSCLSILIDNKPGYRTT